MKLIYFGGDFEVRFLHIAAVKCNHMCACDRVRHQEEDAKTITYQRNIHKSKEIVKKEKV